MVKDRAAAGSGAGRLGRQATFEGRGRRVSRKALSERKTATMASTRAGAGLNCGVTTGRPWGNGRKSPSPRSTTLAQAAAGRPAPMASALACISASESDAPSPSRR